MKKRWDNLKECRGFQIAIHASAIRIEPALPFCEQPQLFWRCVRPRNYSWAELMRRVFEIEVLECERCGGRRRIIAAIHPPDTTRKILECLGLPSRAPPVARAASESLFEEL
jgi:hypothetical protein